MFSSFLPVQRLIQGASSDINNGHHHSQMLSDRYDGVPLWYLMLLLAFRTVSIRQYIYKTVQNVVDSVICTCQLNDIRVISASCSQTLAEPYCLCNHGEPMRMPQTAYLQQDSFVLPQTGAGSGNWSGYCWCFSATLHPVRTLFPGYSWK